MLSGAMSPTHWLLLILVLVVLFGAKKLPEAARGLGRSARILKSEVSGLHEDESKKSEPKSSESPKAIAAESAPAAPEARPAQAQPAPPQPAEPRPTPDA